MKNHIPVYISCLLRHHPESAGLEMDRHGWVSVDALIDGVNRTKHCGITLQQLEEIVRLDNKGRFRFSDDHTRIKACQGHTIPWVEPELTFLPPPEFLYHGTTAAAAEKIMASGFISRMKRHAVHMQQDCRKAWQSATRWHAVPVLLKIAAGDMARDGYTFGVTENGVWCTEQVPVRYIAETLTECPQQESDRS